MTGHLSTKFFISLIIAWTIAVRSINPLNKYWTGQTNSQTREKRTIAGFLKLRSGLPRVSNENMNSSTVDTAMPQTAAFGTK